jgi:hypothetical protein
MFVACGRIQDLDRSQFCASEQGEVPHSVAQASQVLNLEHRHWELQRCLGHGLGKWWGFGRYELSGRYVD